MLAVFDRAVALSPEGLRQPGAAGDGAAGLTDRFREARHGAVTVSIDGGATIAYSSHDQSPLLPRLFAVVDDIFCLFQGTIENIAVLKQQYGLSKGATEVNIIIEAYRTLRDRGPYPADQVIREISGKFAFVLYDYSTNSIFMAAGVDGRVPFYWGVDSEGRLVVSDDAEIVKKFIPLLSPAVTLFYCLFQPKFLIIAAASPLQPYVPEPKKNLSTMTTDVCCP